MDLTSLKEEAYEANLELHRQNLSVYSFGNASVICREKGIFAIKPSGVQYQDLSPNQMVLVDLEGKRVEKNALRPSSDTDSHLVLYQNWEGIGGVAHTHSRMAVAWAQARRPIPCYGTTHADYSFGNILCTEPLGEEHMENYEKETGHMIVRTLEGKSPEKNPMILVAGHGPFTWGKNGFEAAYHSVILEELASMASATEAIISKPQELEPWVLKKHFMRKHGPRATYGQKE
jgi:L-ribulose-5-phosphate 4-epimerase